MKFGIESISMYVPRQVLSLAELADARGVDPAKYLNGIGQELMAVPAPDEDVVTMAANAAEQALEGMDRSRIRSVLFATESGVDQSKAAAIYVHKLLGLHSNCRTVELKQACCSSTSALQFGIATVAQNPNHDVLVIASDVARYGLGSAGEPTQGGGALAMVLSANPKVMEIEPACGYFTDDVMDFWRPNYRDEALVDGKYSIKVYLHALEQAWANYQGDTGRQFEDFSRFCYHLPFTRMAAKAHLHFARIAGTSRGNRELMAQVDQGLLYNRQVGNCYTASLYIGLLSLLENSQEDLSGGRVGLFSYGSGCMGAFFGGVVSPGYRNALTTSAHHDLLANRRRLSMVEYETFYQHQLPVDGADYQTAVHDTGRFRLAGMQDHKRIYEVVDQEAGARPSAAAQPRAAAPLI